LCWNCGKTGHWKIDCLEPPKTKRRCVVRPPIDPLYRLPPIIQEIAIDEPANEQVLPGEELPWEDIEFLERVTADQLNAPEEVQTPASPNIAPATPTPPSSPNAGINPPTPDLERACESLQTAEVVAPSADDNSLTPLYVTLADFKIHKIKEKIALVKSSHGILRKQLLWVISNSRCIWINGPQQISFTHKTKGRLHTTLPRVLGFLYYGEYSSRYRQLSHLCHNAVCIRKSHILIEDATVNNSRRKCFRSANKELLLDVHIILAVSFVQLIFLKTNQT